MMDLHEMADTRDFVTNTPENPVHFYAGDIVRTKDGELHLVGDINSGGGGCDCCNMVDRDSAYAVARPSHETGESEQVENLRKRVAEAREIAESYADIIHENFTGSETGRAKLPWE